jgi:hypothetical protein
MTIRAMCSAPTAPRRRTANTWRKYQERRTGIFSSTWHTSKEVYFAELRANEFMGSCWCRASDLNLAVEELAPKYDVTIHRGPSLDPEIARHKHVSHR